MMWARPMGAARVACSVIISVLDSHEIVRRQVLYLESIIPAEWEVILLDDGSDPPMVPPRARNYRLSVVYTRDRIPWTQPLARNLGARMARGNYLFFTDIDHIVSVEAVEAAGRFAGDMLVFTRRHAILDESGRLCESPDVLRPFGWSEAMEQSLQGNRRVHVNTFVVRRELFLDAMNGGYDVVRFGRGAYGGDDIEFQDRYERLVDAGAAAPKSIGPDIFVFPDPDQSPHFHQLSRASATEPSS